MWPEEVLPLRVRVERGVIAMKNFALCTLQNRKTHHQMQFSVVLRTPWFFGGVLSVYRGYGERILSLANNANQFSIYNNNNNNNNAGVGFFYFMLFLIIMWTFRFVNPYIKHFFDWKINYKIIPLTSSSQSYSQLLKRSFNSFSKCAPDCYQL